jgi:microcystin-dependent protein
MAGEYLGEVRLFGGNYAPRGYVLCDGQLLDVARYPDLFRVLGATYGGDGVTTFGVPDLRGRIPLHMGQGKDLSHRTIGEMGGLESVALTAGQIPAHEHGLQCNIEPGTTDMPGDGVWAASSVGDSQYASAGTKAAMSPACIADAGDSSPHDNLPPYLAVTFIMAIQGLIPPH